MIELTKTEISILGRPNFQCANIAKKLIGNGVYTDEGKKAEYEQAVFIHWALGLHSKFGGDWADEGEKILRGFDN